MTLNRSCHRNTFSLAERKLNQVSSQTLSGNPKLSCCSRSEWLDGCVLPPDPEGTSFQM